MKKGITACALALMGALLAACGANAQTAQAVIGDLTRTVYGSGSVQPASQPGVYAGTDGTVSAIYKEMGDAVREGEILMTLRDEALDAQISELESALSDAQDAVTATQTHTQYVYRQLYDEDGEPRFDVNTGEPLLGQFSNEITIYAPCEGKIMAIYIEPGDDALAVYREKGAVMMLSTDGRMKVELSGLASGTLDLGDTVVVAGENVETIGVVVNLTRRGTEATIQIDSDEFEMDTPVTVLTADEGAIGEGILEINKPMAVSAYGGTIKGLAVQKGDTVRRGDVLARIVWEEIPLYLDNDSVLRDYAKAKMELDAVMRKREALQVVAPCDGVVVSVDTALDAGVTSGTRLMTLVGTDGMTVMLTVDELDIVSVEPGQAVTLSVDALSDLTFRGTVEKIAPLGNVGSGVTTYDVYIDVGEVDERVLGGMNVSGEIAVQTARSAVIIPTGALQKDGEGYFVTLADGTARRVTPGLMTDERTQIASGLSAGETVVY